MPTDETAASVLGEVLARDWPDGSCRVLAVDGPSGAGKSTLARHISELSGAPVVTMDDLYDGWEGLEAGVDALVEQVLQPATEGRPGSYRRYDWARGEYGDPVTVPLGPLLIVEGVGAGARRCAAHTTLLVWVETPEALRLRRSAERDGPDAAEHLRAWRHLEQQHFRREDTLGRADLVVTG